MINKLVANIKKTNAPIVVGLDPMLKLYSGACTEESIRRVRGDFRGSSRGNLAVQ